MSSGEGVLTAATAAASGSVLGSVIAQALRRGYGGGTRALDVERLSRP
ncbi:Uncharacterised protein [Mycobacteroides abscessus]|nr:Uncharacterised protein [Mycobacteroides abscessus]